MSDTTSAGVHIPARYRAEVLSRFTEQCPAKKRCRRWSTTPRSSSRCRSDSPTSTEAASPFPNVRRAWISFRSTPTELDAFLRPDLNVRQSPTIAAFLAILFSAINGQPPATTLAIPSDFVQQLMEGIGLSGREAGLNGMVARIQALSARAAADDATPSRRRDGRSCARHAARGARAPGNHPVPSPPRPGDVAILGAGGK